MFAQQLGVLLSLAASYSMFLNTTMTGVSAFLPDISVQDVKGLVLSSAALGQLSSEAQEGVRGILQSAISMS